MVTALALEQSCDYPRDSEATLTNIDKLANTFTLNDNIATRGLIQYENVLLQV